MKIISLLSACSILVLFYTKICTVAASVNNTTEAVFTERKSYQIANLIIKDDFKDVCLGYDETCTKSDECCKNAHIKCKVSIRKCICFEGYFWNGSTCYYKISGEDITIAVLLTLFLLAISVAATYILRKRIMKNNCLRNNDETDGEIQFVTMTVIDETSPVDLAPRNRPALLSIISPELPPNYDELSTPPTTRQPSPPPKYDDVMKNDIIFDVI